MKRVQQSFSLLVAAVVVLSGCSIAKSTGTPPAPVVTAESKPATETKPAAESKPANGPVPTGERKEAKLAPQDLAEASATIEAYFTAVVNQDQAMINYLWDRAPESKGAKPTPKTGATIRMEESLPTGAYEEAGVPTVYYTLAVDLGPNPPGGAWAPGVNRRWAQVVKREGGWKVRTMATSPIAFE